MAGGKNNFDIFTDDHIDAVAEYFSGKKEFWDEVYNENALRKNFISCHMRNRKDKVFNFLKSLPRDTPLNVLDSGCGTGVYLQEMKNNGFNAIGVDLSLSMLKSASRKTNQGSLLCTDVCSLPFKSDHFDAVTAVGLIEYMKDDIRTLKELARVVKPGGAVIFTLPNKYKLKNVLDPYYYFVRIWQYLFVKTGIKKKQINDLARFSTNVFFTNRRYTIKKFKHMIAESDP